MKKLKRALDWVLISRTHKGPYRFLIRKWYSVTNINTLSDIISTEYFREELTPVELPLHEIDSLLVLAPHQDDETIGAGGTLLLASQYNSDIKIIFCTDGHDGTDTSVMIRRQEARKVVTELNADMFELGISNQTMCIEQQHIQSLAQQLIEQRPKVVLLPWLLDRPAKHRLINLLLYVVTKTYECPPFEVWGYQVHNTVYPNAYVDITSVIEDKRRLLEFYVSQNKKHHYDHRTIGLNAWNHRIIEVHDNPSAGPKFVEVFFTLPLLDYQQLVRRFYFNDPATVFSNNQVIIQSATDLKQNFLKQKLKT